jgi:hypothetical protein
MYCDAKILVYPRRTVYLNTNVHRSEQYNLLKVLLGTLCVDDMAVIMKVSRFSKVIHHEDECIVEIDLPDSNINRNDESRMQEMASKLYKAIPELSWETATVNRDNERKPLYYKSDNVLNPLMRLKTIIEVSI